MSNQFQFEVGEPENILEGLQQANIFGFNLMKRKNSEIPLICIRHGPYLISYQFDVSTDSWKFYWKVNVFLEGDNFNAIDYPWFVGDILGTGSDIIVIRNQVGLKFLQPRDNPAGIDEITMDSRFGSFGSYIFILMGRFYSDNSIVGVLHRNNEGHIRVYGIMKDILESKGSYPLRELSDLQFSHSWKEPETKIFLTDLRRQGKDVFVLLTMKGLEINEFNDKWKLIEVMRTKTIKRLNYYDTLFFGHFISKSFKDIIHLNDDGLFLYKYVDEVKDFVLLNHNMEFTPSNGWRAIFADSIKICDINNDGMDEVVFTGTYGLNVYSFNASLTKWENILNSSQLQGLLRYSKVIGLVTSSKSTIFSQDTKGALQSMNIIESKNSTIPVDFEDPKKPLKPFQRTSILPTIISRMSYDEVPDLRWTELWNDGFLKEAVRPQTGQVEFSIPLVKTGPIAALESAIGISYNSQDDSSDLLGIGWTIPIADYYIVVNHKGSIYPVDYDYYLIRGGRRANLIVKNTNLNSIEFEIKEQPDLKINYNTDDEKWFVGNDMEQIVFGISDDKKSGVLQIQLNWPNWKGSGTDTSKLEQYIHAWYLCERRFLKSGISVFYKYDTTSAITGDKAYTTSIRLVSISDFKGFEISFDYSAKTEPEFKRLGPINVDEIVTFPLQLVHTHYLKSCNVRTSTYQQKLDFDYQLLGGKRLLVQISQPVKGHTETIFKFDYKDELNNFVMTKCTFLEKTFLSFDYSKTTSLIPPFSLQYSVNDRPEVKFGSDYAIMAYKLKFEVQFRLTNLALTTPIFKGTTLRQDSTGVVQSFAIKAVHNSFVIIQKTGFHIKAFTFTKADDKWSDIPSIETFHQQSIMCYGESFYAIAEQNTRKLVIIERDFGGNRWKRFVVDISDRTIKTLQVQNHMIAGHDGDQLLLIYKEENKWTTNVIDRDEIYQSTEKTISLFDIDVEIKKQIISIFDREKLQLFNNMIVATSLEEYDGHLIIIAKLFLLDSNYRVVKTGVEKLSRETLLDLKLEKEADGSTFILKYYKSDGKYRMKIVDFTGNISQDLNKISNQNKRADEKNVRLSKLNALDGWKNFFTKSIIFDPTLYRVQLSKDGVFIGDDNFLRMTGVEWKKESRPSMDYVRLGNSFILGFDKKDSKSVHLYYQQSDGKPGQLIKQIKLHGPGQFLNRYPAYLAYQLTAANITILTFKDPKTIGKEESYAGEELLFESNLTNLITLAKVNGQHGTTHYEWRVRSLSVFMEKKFYLIVEKWSITSDNVSRTTAFERTSKYKRDERILEENLRIIPGGNKTVSGWIEHVMVNNMETSERTTTTNYYNALGNLVSVENDKAEATKESDVEDESKQDNKTLTTQQIFDRSGHMEISNFAPYTVSDDEGVYLGFETYEENQGMEFDITSIVRGKFAFTGDSYLNLQRNAKLTKILKPKDTKNIFIASCYIRSSSAITLNSEVKYLRALIAAQNMQPKVMLSKILRQSGEWFYLESYIDLITLNRQHGQLQGLEITIEVTPDTANFLDLDHIRFSPLTQNFEAAVYNERNGKITTKIMGNGLVSRTVFDRQDREIAAINSSGQIEHFTRATKTGELFPPPRTSINKQPSSKMKIEPESGFYEHFDGAAFSNRWTVSDDRMWSISRGQLIHRGLNSDTITANANLIDESCAALRLGYNLRLIQSSLTLRWSSNMSITFTSLIENQATLTLNASQRTVVVVVDSLPVNGELIIFIELERIVVWIDGVLIIDQGHGHGNLTEPWSDFKFEMKNYLIIEDLFIMNRPRIYLEYFNGLSEKIQELQFESDKVILVSHTLYDELGRGNIVTKPTRVSRNSYQTLFAFYPEFVQNENPRDPNSVWQTGLLKGDVDTLNKNDLGVPYLRTEFDSNPLNEKISEGLPGPDHSVSGPYAKRFSTSLQVDFMSNLFPTRLGYHQQVEILANGSKKVSVFDSKKNLVARYTQVAGFDHLLSTSEYNDDNKLVKVLPPLYHELAQTAFKFTPWINGNDHLTMGEKKLQDTHGTHFAYDRDGHLIEKKTPDTGTIKYMYASDGSLRFMVTMGLYNSVNKVVYFLYDEFKQLVRTGHLSTPPSSLDELKQYLHAVYEARGLYLPNSIDYQLIQYSDQNDEPMERGLMKMFVTYSGMDPVKEIIMFNNDFDVSSRSIYALPQQISFDSSASIISVFKDYNRRYVTALTYPGIYKGKPFKLVYSYDKLGNVIALGTETNYKHFASFSYHVNGLVSQETHTPTSMSTFSRLYKYNSPGFLERITDPYLTEDLSYTHSGYGINGFGDGTILLTTFNAKWANNVDHRLFRVNTVDENAIPAVCIDELKYLGYLDSLNNPKRMYIPAEISSMPLECRGGVSLKLAKLVAENHIPRFYGFRFAYGNHMELINAKYFTSETHRLIDPLQGHSFLKSVPNLSKEQSQEIFDILSRNKYILSDQRTDRASIIGKKGKPFFRSSNLERDLKELNTTFEAFTSVIISLLTSTISQKKSLSLDIFQKYFFKWRNINPDTIEDIELEKASEDSTTIFGMLSRKNYMTQMAFEKDFINILSKYNNVLPEIVRTLNHHFIHALGETPFDVEMYEIDSNGNHRLFYTGFERYKFAYKEGTNQIDDIKIDNFQDIRSGMAYKMAHDIDGNVVRALHKNIEQIEYHRTSQRATSIRLTDGRKLMFYYDAQGERILKRVLSSSGSITKETYYIRDEQGRVLLEREITHFPVPSSKVVTVTMYIYGPRSLIGFIRNDKFHSVITDHADSTRLIIRDGQVVAAFDYLPYGKIMRLYSSNPQDLIAYRYAGQEFDEETGLYNFHARFYDPEIGRFYQPDPQAQYYSPYKYAGNSPTTFMDSDDKLGQMALFAVAEAYLGASSANVRLNPSDWNFKDSGNGIGPISGGIAENGNGASFPSIDIVDKVGLGAGGMYSTANAVNGNWNLAEWKWDSPKAWNTMYQGFVTGASLPGGLSGTHKFAGTFGQKTFLGETYGAAAAARITYGGDVMANQGNAAFREWDLTSPETWNSLLNGFNTGVGMPSHFVDVGRSFKNLAQTPKKLRLLLNKLDNISRNFRGFAKILKDPKNPMYKFAVLNVFAYYYISAANEDFDVTNTFSTYKGALEGIFFGKETNERIVTTVKNRQTPKPQMVDLISYKAIDITRVRRFAMDQSFNGDVYLSATLSASTDQLMSMDHNQLINDSYNNSIIASTSGGVPITFWPLSLLRIIKSTFNLRIQYAGYKTRQMLRSESIPLIPPQPTSSKESSNSLYETNANPGFQFDKFKDNYSVLEMGDQWLANTNMQGNFMWAFVLIRKLFGYKSYSSKSVTFENSNTIEFDIQAYEIVNEFFKGAKTAAITCGIEEIIHEIIDSGNLDYLVRAVKVKLMRYQQEHIAKLLFESLFGNNVNQICKMSSPKQTNMYKELMERKIYNLNTWLISCPTQTYSTDLHQNSLSKCANNTNCKFPLDIPSVGGPLSFPLNNFS